MILLALDLDSGISYQLTTIMNTGRGLRCFWRETDLPINTTPAVQ